MPSSIKLVPTAVDSWPLSAAEEDKIEEAGLAAQQRRRRLGALNSRTELYKTTINRQETIDNDNHDLAGEKELEVQADTRNGRYKPQPAANTSLPAAPITTTASSDHHDTGNKRKENKKKNKQSKNNNKNTDKKPVAEEDDTDDTYADDQSDSCLPFRRRGNRHGPRKEDKGDKGDKGGRIGFFQKLKMGLFSRKKKSPEPANPYANPITPYQQVRNQLAQGPDSGEPGPLNTRMGSFSTSNPPPPYNQSPSVASTSSRFGDNKYGNQNGYGSNPYDANASAYSANQRGPGGYGGLDEDAGQNALFGDASGRYVPPQKGTPGSSAIGSAISSPNQFDRDPSKSALLGNAQDRYSPYPQAQSPAGAADDEFDGYGAARPLTEEEQDMVAAQAINKEANEVRGESVATLQRSIAIADGAINTAIGTYARIGEQGDRLHRTERNLDEAAIKSRIAEDGVKELKTAGNMIRAPKNPFTTRKRQMMEEKAILERHRNDRETREETRKHAFQSTMEIEKDFKEFPINKNRLLGNAGKRDFDFPSDSDEEFDDDDDEDEREKKIREKEISKGLVTLHNQLGTLNMAAHGMQSRIADQNVLLDRLEEKSDAVDDHVRMNRARLDRFR
ncbi:Protein transport protein SEC9 [Cytospora mali]|uniref:Protein transport protein SEC9 n=1 Tax=Cytospora mali TaxID=578113 RepID=A0A194V011_CYTMA|nr:Protein transport protein SEC9 [Valsa mali var. pyri (nom. inval.)]